MAKSYFCFFNAAIAKIKHSKHFKNNKAKEATARGDFGNKKRALSLSDQRSVKTFEKGQT
jgi:hypothetical protein